MSNTIKEFLAKAADAAGLGNPDGIHCINCRQVFNNINCPTELDRRESKISGFCGTCFDSTFSEEEE